MILRIPATSCTWPIMLDVGTSHWNGRPGGGCSHGPRSMDWSSPFKWISWLGCKLGTDRSSPSVGWRLWVYTRRGALYFDLFIDRRHPRVGSLI